MIPMQIAADVVRRFLDEEDGAVLAELLIILPVFFALLLGLVEFSTVLLTKSKVEYALRDAARYRARCPNWLTDCDARAKNIAVFGRVVVPSGTKPRTKNWATSNVAVSSTSVPISYTVAGTTYTVPATRIRASSTYTYVGSPFFSALGLPTISIVARHDDRYVGW
jgi:Flp pilus assembly protein TadG